MGLAEGGGLHFPDDVALGVDDLLRRPQVVVLVVEGLGFALALPGRLDPHRVGAPQPVRLPAVLTDQLRRIAAVGLVFRRQPFLGVEIGVRFRLAKGRPGAAVPAAVQRLPDPPSERVVLVAGDRVAVRVLHFAQPVGGVVDVLLVVRRVLAGGARRGGLPD